MATRYQLRFRDDAEKLLNWMSNELKIEPKDVILDALAVYHFAITEARQHRQIGSFDPESRDFKAIATPSLQALQHDIQVTAGAGA